MKTQSVKLIILLATLLVTMLISTFPQTIVAQKADPESRQITLNDLAAGEKIASGRKVEGGCQFEPMDMTLVRRRKR